MFATGGSGGTAGTLSPVPAGGSGGSLSGTGGVGGASGDSPTLNGDDGLIDDFGSAGTGNSECIGVGCFDGGLGLSQCGNGVLNDGELCDDGNTTQADGCNGVCNPEPNFACGQAGEPCWMRLRTYHGAPTTSMSATPAESRGTSGRSRSRAR